MPVQIQLRLTIFVNATRKLIVIVSNMMANIHEEKVDRRFVVETNGYCFICAKKICRVDGDTGGPVPVNSLRCLSRYLKLNMRKVFSEGGPIPQKLLKRVERSELEVAMCGECASVNGRFVELYKQLERIEMEVESCIKVIHEKLSESTEEHVVSGTKESIAKIANALRNEATQKSSRRISVALPKLQLKHLTLKEVAAGKLKCRETRKFQTDLGTLAEPVIKSESEVKTEMDDENGQANSDYDNASDNPDPEAGGSHCNANDTDDEIGEAKDAPPENHVKIPKRIASISNKGIPTAKYSTKEPVTGLYKCIICGKKFAQQSSFSRHYKAQHLNLKFKCEECGKEFSHSTPLQRHFSKVHQGIRFKCNVCGKNFSKPFTYQQHYESVHLGRKHKCGVCKKAFSSKSPLCLHEKNSCRGNPKALKGMEKSTHVCDLCGKMSMHEGHFRIHRERCGRKNSKDDNDE